MIDMHTSWLGKPSRSEQNGAKTWPVSKIWTSIAPSIFPMRFFTGEERWRTCLWNPVVDSETRDVSLDGFVVFWFREPRPLCGTYDFFLLKVERFVEFVHEMAPELRGIVEREAEELR